MSRTKADPRSLTEYLEWHAATLERDVVSALDYYTAVAPVMCGAFTESALWQAILSTSAPWAQEYLDRTGYQLWAFDGQLPSPVWKSRESFALKVFRRNVIENRAFPNPPEGDWYSSKNWFSRTNDIVRTCLVVKYLDGVEEVCTRTAALAATFGYALETSYEARDEGYYAAHLRVPAMEFRVPSRNWDYTMLAAPVEIQVTTQVKDVIRDLTHPFYEARRMEPTTPNRKWQWDYRCEEFSANYLGHTLHYLEGTIMDIRDRAKKGKTDG